MAESKKGQSILRANFLPCGEAGIFVDSESGQALRVGAKYLLKAEVAEILDGIDDGKTDIIHPSVYELSAVNNDGTVALSIYQISGEGGTYYNSTGRLEIFYTEIEQYFITQ